MAAPGRMDHPVPEARRLIAAPDYRVIGFSGAGARRGVRRLASEKFWAAAALTGALSLCVAGAAVFAWRRGAAGSVWGPSGLSALSDFPGAGSGILGASERAAASRALCLQNPGAADCTPASQAKAWTHPSSAASAKAPWAVEGDPAPAPVAAPSPPAPAAAPAVAPPAPPPAASPAAAPARAACTAPGEGCLASRCCSLAGYQCYEKKPKLWADCRIACSTADGWTCNKIGPRTPVKNAKCSANGVENCAISKCCSGQGLQCYEKDSTWSACMPKCEHKGWSCRKLGRRTPLLGCSDANKNCRKTKCCKTPGMQCYKMNKFWSTCAYACQAGVGWSKNWTSCETLGPRAPLRMRCTWSGQACTITKMCCHPGQKCYRKNPLEAYCSDKAVPASWDGTVVGGSRGEFQVKPAAPGQARGTSLFCFMAVLPGSYEEGLKSNALSKGASIFGCDASAAFQSWQSKRVAEGTWKSVVNTDVFVNVWRNVLKDGRYRQHDWTVKVDPDTVFFPDRLKYHLKQLNAPKSFPIYIKNTAMTFGFLGAIEVLSREALDKYFRDGSDRVCLNEVGSHSGEDGFMKACMDMVGAGYMTDIQVLYTPAEKNCAQPARVAFHAFKDVGAWNGCYNAAIR